MSEVTPRKLVFTLCPYCGEGCGIILHVENDRVAEVSGDENHPANHGRLCTKGAHCAPALTADDRLAFAQMRSSRSDAFSRVAVLDTIQAIADRLRSVIAEHGPDAVAFYVSGPMSVGFQYLANKLCKGFSGTNSIDSNSRLCMASAATPFVIVQDAYHRTETYSYADVLLPGALWAEGDGTLVNSERVVTLRQAAVKPPGEAMADWEIIAWVARAMDFAGFEFNSASEVFDEIRRTANPVTGYDLRGISHAQWRGGALQWPCGPDEITGTPICSITETASTSCGRAAAALQFPTKSGRAQFWP